MLSGVSQGGVCHVDEKHLMEPVLLAQGVGALPLDSYNNTL